MRIQAIFFNLVLSIFPLVAVAGSGHDHGHSHKAVTQIQAEAVAIKTVTALVDKGKIDNSWKSISIMKSEKKDFGGHLEWVISFMNKNISDPSKQTLFVFLTSGGEYIAANYTGE